MQEIVIIGNGTGVAKILKSGRSGLDEATAAFIVTACNSHAALVAENKRLREALESALEWTRGDKAAAEHADMSTALDAETLQARCRELRAALESAKD